MIMIAVIFTQVTSGAAITFGFIESLLELYLETFDLKLVSIGITTHHKKMQTFANKYSFAFFIFLFTNITTTTTTTTITTIIIHLFSVTLVGFCFLGYAIAYTLFTIIAGVLTDSKVKVLPFMMVMVMIVMTMMTFLEAFHHHHNF